MAVCIVCANKPSGDLHDPHEAIEDYGWIEDGTTIRKISQRQIMVNWVKSGGFAYVQDAYGRRADCYVRTSVNGTEFLQTKRDNIWTNDLVNLQSCRL
jgi:hypothetical protein